MEVAACPWTPHRTNPSGLHMSWLKSPARWTCRASSDAFFCGRDWEDWELVKSSPHLATHAYSMYTPDLTWPLTAVKAAPLLADCFILFLLVCLTHFFPCHTRRPLFTALTAILGAGRSLSAPASARLWLSGCLLLFCSFLFGAFGCWVPSA